MTRGFNTEREAKKALREAQAMADKGNYILSTKTSYGEYLKEWFDIRQSNLGRQTIANHSININRHIIPLISQIQLTELKMFIISRSSLVNSAKKDWPKLQSRRYSA